MAKGPLKQCPKKGCTAMFRLKSRYEAHLRKEHGVVKTW